MLVVDEFPTGVLLDGDGTVDAGRFPSFARLSEGGRWYRNYSTVNNFTIHAVPALLSAEAPEADAVPLLDDHPRNLFTLLGGTYEFNVSEAITRLCPTVENGELAGRTANNRVVNFAGGARLVGDYADVRITAALPHSLRGEVVTA